MNYQTKYYVEKLKNSRLKSQSSITQPRNTVIEELTVKGATLGIIYGSIFIFIELIVMQIFGSADPHVMTIHNGIIMSSTVGLLTLSGLIIGILAKNWDSRNPLEVNDAVTSSHHEQHNPYRRLFNSLSTLLRLISERFHFLKTHEVHPSVTNDTEQGSGQPDVESVLFGQFDSPYFESSPFLGSTADNKTSQYLQHPLLTSYGAEGRASFPLALDKTINSKHSFSGDQTGSVWLHSREYDNAPTEESHDLPSHTKQ